MQFKAFLRYTLIVGTFLVPFIPFLVASSMFFPFVTGKNFSFRILTEVLVGAWILLALLDVRYRPRFSWILAAVVGFVGVIFVADIFAENPFKAFWSNFERMEGWVTLAHLLGYFLVASTVLNTEKLWGRFAATSVGASVIMGAYGLAQIADFIDVRQGGDRLDGTFGNATYLAVYMLVHIFITALLLLKWRLPAMPAHAGQTGGASWVYWAGGAAMLLQTYILLQTETRGAILGLVGGVFVAAVLALLTLKDRPALRKAGAGVAVGLLVLGGAFFTLRDSTFIQSIPGLSRVADITLEETTVQSRFMVWNMAWQGFQERPLLGWGQEGFNFVFNKYYDPQMYAQEPWFDRAHSIFFDWLVAGGALGLLMYVAMPLAFLYYLWLGRRRDGAPVFSMGERSVLTGLLAAYMFHNLFVFDNIGSYLFFFSLLAYGHWRATPPAPDAEALRKPVSEQAVKVYATPAVLVATLVAIYFVNVPSITTAQTLISALSQQQGGVTQNVELFEELLERETIGRQEVREQAIQFAMQLRQAQGVPIELQQRVFSMARAGMQEELERVPNDARLLVFVGSFLNNFGQPGEARAYLERARELSPNKQAMYFALGATYLGQDDYETALDIYREAYELAPEFDEARIRYAAAAIYADQEELSDQLLEERFGTTTVDNDFLVSVYADTERHDRVLAIWQKRIQKRQNDPQAHLSLAAAYFQAGDKVSAIAEIRTAIELNPQLKAQGEEIIRRIEAGENPLQ